MANTSVITYDSVSDMMSYATAPSANEKASLLGYYAAGDGGGGDFYWDAVSTTTADNGVVIKVTAIATGRWIRLFNGTLNPRYYGAKGDGTTDDSTVFNKCLANIYSSNIYVPDGTYIVHNLSINQTLDVSLSAKAILMLKANSNYNENILNINAQYTIVNGGIFDGNKANQTHSNNCILINADDVTVRNCEARATNSSGIQGLKNRPSILNNYVHDTDYIALFFSLPATPTYSVEGGIIEGNLVDRTSSGTSIVQPGIDILGSNSPVYNSIRWRVIGNVVKMPLSPTDTNAICIELFGNAHHSTVSNNVTYGGRIGVSMSNAFYSAVTGNTIESASDYGIEFATSYSTATGNTILGNALTSGGIAVDYGSNCTISSNTILDAKNNGIYLATSVTYTNIIGNVISFTTSGSSQYCVNLDQNCKFINISGNSFSGLSGTTTIAKAGITLHNCSNITVGTNTFDSFVSCGILMFGDGTGSPGFVIDAITIANNIFNAVPSSIIYNTVGGTTTTIGNNIVSFGNTGFGNYLDWKNQVLFIAGTGTPASAVTASVGAVYLRENGGAATTLYVKESGTNTNTGWVGK